MIKLDSKLALETVTATYVDSSHAALSVDIDIDNPPQVGDYVVDGRVVHAEAMEDAMTGSQLLQLIHSGVGSKEDGAYKLHFNDKFIDGTANPSDIAVWVERTGSI